MSDRIAEVMEPVPGEPPKKPKGDLGVRTVSAVVMVGVAGLALWDGGYFFGIFVLLVAAVCLGEFLRLIWMATTNLLLRSVSAVAASIYVGLAAFFLLQSRYSWLHDDSGLMGLITTASIVGVVVFTDIGAYFAGRMIGGPKIAPSISPSKTWAGLFGGMVAASILCVFVNPLLNLASKPGFEGMWFDIDSRWLWAVTCGAILAGVAQAGDFFESWLKRRAKVKDSSALIPGHGGIFDRIDGLLPVVLVWSVFGVRPF